MSFLYCTSEEMNLWVHGIRPSVHEWLAAQTLFVRTSPQMAQHRELACQNHNLGEEALFFVRDLAMETKIQDGVCPVQAAVDVKDATQETTS